MPRPFSIAESSPGLENNEEPNLLRQLGRKASGTDYLRFIAAPEA
jgi:hypothetical protein